MTLSLHAEPGRDPVREAVRVTVREGIAEIVLDRPPVNAMSRPFIDGIAGAFAGAAADEAVGAVVLTGAGRSFSAGVDLKAATGTARDAGERLLEALNRLFHAVYSCPRPVVAAINGHAIAGGLVLALACDYRIATREPFRISLAEVHAGIPYPVGALEIVRQELRPTAARRLALLGHTIDAANAGDEQIIDEWVAPERLAHHAWRVASDYAKLPPGTYARIKNQLRATSLARMKSALDGGDPLAGDWFSDETFFHSRRILRQRK